MPLEFNLHEDIWSRAAQPYGFTALWFYRFHNLTDDLYKSLSYFPFARQFLKLNFKDTRWKNLEISKLNTYQF